MSAYPYQYQCLAKCGELLLAAKGSSIDSFSLHDGSLLSTWTCPSIQPTPQALCSKSVSESPLAETLVDTSSTPPAKRRKLVGVETEEDGKGLNPAAHEKKKKKQNSRANAVTVGLGDPSIVCLVATKTGSHVIAVTGEDKSIRVFENTLEEGRHELKQISLRAMPKRPCSISITPDNTAIISADKFGDVYSLPIIPEVSPALSKSSPQAEESIVDSMPYVPAANELTIHSQRNRKALENQRRQAHRTASKPASNADSTLLLGHVSMLTDLALTSLRGRNYILTADRDEHIRVSRGIPQAHIIESICHGHSEFVTSLCVPEGLENILISGGGDDELFVWEWETGTLVSKADLRRLVELVMQPLITVEGFSTMGITVSGLYHSRLADIDSLIATCEGVPALFIFTIKTDKTLEYLETIHLPGNAVDVIHDIVNTVEDVGCKRLVVSIDTCHKPGSTSEAREAMGPINRLLTFNIDPQLRTIVEAKEFTFAEVDDVNNQVGGSGGDANLSNLLYYRQNLRKRDEDSKGDYD